MLFSVSWAESQIEKIIKDALTPQKKALSKSSVTLSATVWSEF